MEEKIEDLKEMRLLKQREIEWIDMKIQFYEKKIKERDSSNIDTDDSEESS